MERKKPIKEKSHKGIWRSDAPEASQGQTRGRPRDTLDIWAWFMCKSILKGQNVPGTDGTYQGTDGTCPRNRRDAHQGVSRQNSLCLLVFSFPKYCAILIAKLFRACFLWVSHKFWRDTLQNGVSHWCACVKLSARGVRIAPCWGVHCADLP